MNDRVGQGTIPCIPLGWGHVAQKGPLSPSCFILPRCGARGVNSAIIDQQCVIQAAIARGVEQFSLCWYSPSPSSRARARACAKNSNNRSQKRHRRRATIPNPLYKSALKGTFRAGIIRFLLPFHTSGHGSLPPSVTPAYWFIVGFGIFCSKLLIPALRLFGGVIHRCAHPASYHRGNRRVSHLSDRNYTRGRRIQQWNGWS